MHRVTRRRLAIALSLLCIAEIALLAAAWRVPAPADGGSVAKLPGPAPAAPLAVAAFEPAPLESFAAFVERPLFLASRRPPPANDRPAARDKGDVSARGVMFGPYRFTGIVVTPKVRIAFVTDTRSGRSIALSEGESLGEWRCAEIAAQRVMLERDGRRETVSLHETR